MLWLVAGDANATHAVWEDRLEETRNAERARRGEALFDAMWLPVVTPVNHHGENTDDEGKQPKDE